ncbi:hypothetical protein C0Q70_20298 [Pomacea canaliculata]|uniref:Uncharacterized protein n=1 Tax=Pomacea canaliculata TaxID=400727 RepID=A0A2T7NF42_POMCA|nr:hypothetical protein C0Q70_20298 [Pomacea canaliculata]
MASIFIDGDDICFEAGQSRIWDRASADRMEKPLLRSSRSSSLQDTQHVSVQDTSFQFEILHEARSCAECQSLDSFRDDQTTSAWVLSEETKSTNK